MTYAIECRNVQKTYGSGPTAYQALKGVDFVAEPGEFVMLSGPSGSGKTTLLSILGCVLTASSGTGEVRVSRAAANGRELELYRVVPGEMCLVSSACLFSGITFTARGTTTTATQLVMLPATAFRTALADEPFRDFVLGLFAVRMADLTGLIEAVAFQRLDHRLAPTLLGHGSQVRATHQALADELGTAREIITRLLHRFERSGWVELSRECITIRDSVGLRQLATQGTRP